MPPSSRQLRPPRARPARPAGADRRPDTPETPHEYRHTAAAENDRVEAGQVLAEIDPTPYSDQVELARARLATAGAELKRQQIALARLKIDVPLQIEIARWGLESARADRGKADESLTVTG